MFNWRMQPFAPWVVNFIIIVLVASGLYATSLYSYVLFHSLAEMFSIVVAWSIFAVTWNARQLIDNNYLLLVGVAYLFVGGLDLVHTLAYKGMGVFPGYDSNLPTQLWIAARYLETLSLLAAITLIGRKRIQPAYFVAAYAVIVSLLLVSIFSGIFPTCYVEGAGLTPFKKISEYIIAAILLACAGLLWSRRETFDQIILRWLIAAIFLTIGAELAFTFYASVYGLSNLVGHFLKIFSFYCIYVAIVKTGIQRPYDLLFKELKRSEDRYRGLFEDAPISLWEDDYSAIKAY
jgi:hypothetical protein